MAVQDTQNSAARGLLAVAHWSQLARMASGDQMKKLTEFVARYPDPNAVGSDFVINLLAVSRTYMLGVEREGSALPEGLTEWRQAAFDRFERELPIRTWRLIANSDELPSMKELAAAKKAGGPQYDALADQVRAIGRFFGDWVVIKLLNVSDYASDLGVGDLHKKYLEDDKAIASLHQKVKVALDFVGEAGRELQHRIAIEKISNQIEARLEEAAADAQQKAGANAYGQGHRSDVGTSRTGGQTPSSVAIRMKS